MSSFYQVPQSNNDNSFYDLPVRPSNEVVDHKHEYTEATTTANANLEGDIDRKIASLNYSLKALIDEIAKDCESNSVAAQNELRCKLKEQNQIIAQQQVCIDALEARLTKMEQRTEQDTPLATKVEILDQTLKTLERDVIGTFGEVVGKLNRETERWISRGICELGDGIMETVDEQIRGVWEHVASEMGKKSRTRPKNGGFMDIVELDQKEMSSPTFEELKSREQYSTGVLGG